MSVLGCWGIGNNMEWEGPKHLITNLEKQTTMKSWKTAILQKAFQTALHSVWEFTGAHQRRNLSPRASQQLSWDCAPEGVGNSTDICVLPSGFVADKKTTGVSLTHAWLLEVEGGNPWIFRITASELSFQCAAAISGWTKDAALITSDGMLYL